VIGTAAKRLAAFLRAGSSTPEQRSRLRTWTFVVVAVVIGQIAWMVLLRGPRLLERETVLVMGQLIIGMGLIAIAGLIVSTPGNALRLDAATSRRIIIGGTLLLQAVGIWLLWPALNEDLPRYRVEAVTWLSGRSPYVTPPVALKNSSNLLDYVDRLTPEPKAVSIYPPVAQTVFIAARGLELATSGPAEPDLKVRSWRDALPVLSFAERGLILRLFAALAAVACAFVLVRILEGRGMTPWLAVLFAWNPLLLMEAAGSGHIDVIGILLILTMLRMLQTGKPALATLAFCLACGIKPVAILFAPLVIRQVWLLRDWRHAQRSIGMVVVTMVLVYLPILSVESGLSSWLDALKAYAQLEHANSAILALLGDNAAARMLPPLVAIGMLLWALRRQSSIEGASYWIMLTTLLVSPLALPQMVLWPLCFVPLLRRSFGWGALAWSATAALAYVMWRHPAGELPGRILAAEYLPVLLALAVQLREVRARQPIAVPADATSAA
jgi:hypothetical protein